MRRYGGDQLFAPRGRCGGRKSSLRRIGSTLVDQGHSARIGFVPIDAALLAVAYSDKLLRFSSGSPQTAPDKRPIAVRQ